MADYINASDHPVPLASGRVLAPGEAGEPDLRDPQDKALRDDGTLIKADDGKEKKA